MLPTTVELPHHTPFIYLKQHILGTVSNSSEPPFDYVRYMDLQSRKQALWEEEYDQMLKLRLKMQKKSQNKSKVKRMHRFHVLWFFFAQNCIQRRSFPQLIIPLAL